MNFTPVLKNQMQQGSQHRALPAIKPCNVVNPLSVTELRQSFNQVPQLMRINLTGLAWSFKLIDRKAINTKPLTQVVILSVHDDLPFAVKLKSSLGRMMPTWEYPKFVFNWNGQLARKLLNPEFGDAQCQA